MRKEACRLKIEIWQEGYLCTGMEGIPAKAECVGVYEAIDFKDAVRQYCKINKQYTISYHIQDDTFSDYGCMLFDNEKEARESFG